MAQFNFQRLLKFGAARISLERGGPASAGSGLRAGVGVIRCRAPCPYVFVLLETSVQLGPLVAAPKV